MPKLTYQLGNTSGYKFNIESIDSNPYDYLSFFDKTNFPDLEITRPGVDTDLSLLHTKHLISVNGYVYPTTLINDRLFVRNATEAMLKSRQNNVGILSIQGMQGELVKTPITASMLSTEAPLQFYDKLIITFEREMKHSLLVMGGYMVFEHPEYFYRVSDRSFVLRLDRLNFVNKLYELSRYTNIYERLSLQVSPVNPNMLDGLTVRSDATITNFMTLDNTFLVEIPCERITTRKIFLEHSKLPNTFRTEVDPVYPLLGGQGKILEYIKQRTNDTKFNVYTSDAYYDNFLLSSVPQPTIESYNNHRQPGKTYTLTKGFFLEVDFEF